MQIPLLLLFSLYAQLVLGVAPFNFTESAGPIDVTGNHAFMAPSAGDFRGPCPGLNALANHGYIDRCGVTTMRQAIAASIEVFNMGLDAATLAAALGVITGGNRCELKFSIGESPPCTIRDRLSGCGCPTGLSKTHNKFEADASATRSDSFLNNGDASTLNLEHFMHLYHLQDPESPDANYDLEIIQKQRAYTFQYAIAHNPYFFSGPITGFVSTINHLMIPALFSNNSAQTQLNGEVLRTFYGVRKEGRNGDLVVYPGHEQIPENWYRRSTPYGVREVLRDLIDTYRKDPFTLAIGGNTGKVNSFVGVGVGDFTGGVYNVQTLLEGNNLRCFLYQVIQSIPDGVAAEALRGVTEVLQPFLLDCPVVAQWDYSVFDKYPRAKGLYQ